MNIIPFFCAVVLRQAYLNFATFESALQVHSDLCGSNIHGERLNRIHLSLSSLDSGDLKLKQDSNNAENAFKHTECLKEI
jgi:uncharacterized protein YjbI with pentapeptide repeats